jgi:vesicle coat complex subunit
VLYIDNYRYFIINNYRYAEEMPDIALLSINTFQKDLNDGNPLIRF